jgi:hypothetical protein
MRIASAALVFVLLAAAAPAPARAAAPVAKGARAAPAAKVLPFIANDYTRAVAEAKARRVPLFIESWAPW